MDRMGCPKIRCRYLIPLTPALMLGWSLWYWLPTNPRATMAVVPRTYKFTSVYFSPDSRLLATFSFPWKNNPGLLRLWDVANGGERKTLHKGPREIGSLAFSADGKKCAGLLSDGDIQVWDTDGGEVQANYPRKNWPESADLQLLFSTKGRLLVCWTMSGKLWDVTTGQELFTLPEIDKLPGNLDWLYPTERFLVATKAGKAKAWKLETLKLAAEFSSRDDSFPIVCDLTSDARLLAGLFQSQNGPNMFKVLTAGGGEEHLPLGDDQNLVFPPALSPDGRAVAVFITQVGGQSTPPLSWLLPSKSTDSVNQVRILEIPEGRLLCSLDQASQGQFSPNGQTLAVVDDYGVVRLYDYPLRRPWRTILFWPVLLAVSPFFLRFANFCCRRFKPENTPPHSETAATHPLPSSILPGSSGDAASATHGVPDEASDPRRGR